MKKQMLKKMIAGLLATATVIGMVGCGEEVVNEKTTEKTNETESTVVTSESSELASTEESSGITFPLEEEVEFTFMLKSAADCEELLEKSLWWQQLYEATNVKVNVVGINGEFAGTLNAMYSVGDGPDLLGSVDLSESDFMKMAYNDFFIPLQDYLTDPEIMPNFNERVLSENPQVLNVSTAPDGNIYGVPRYDANMGSYLESPLYINKKWVEALGMKVEDIKTIEDLENVLMAFKEKDMNGNGDTTDEVPIIALNGHWCGHLEALFGLWGIPTKDSTYENYMYVEDGKVLFAPVQEAYKDAIITLSDWYDKGLIWSECFTGAWKAWDALVNSEESKVGMFTAKTPPAGKEDEYVVIAPVAVEGYEAKWYFHPGYMGSKGMLAISSECENPEILMAWIDQLYTFENSIGVQHGLEEEGRWMTNAEGKVEMLVIDQNKDVELKDQFTRFMTELGNATMPYALTVDDYDNKMVKSTTVQAYDKNYTVYESYLNDEVWPRPYTSDEDVNRLTELRTDILNTVSVNKAKWITGEADIEADWDAYVESLNKMGVDEFVEIMQKSYDAFIN